MTGTNCDLFAHIQSRSYLNHLVYTTLERGVIVAELVRIWTDCVVV
jgi:hypothetical protein